MSQLVLSETVLAAPKHKWAHTLLIPAAVSILLLLLHVVLVTAPVKRCLARLCGREVDEEDLLPQPPVVRQHTGFFPDLRSHISSHGGPTVFTWKMLRLLACLVLTALTIAAIVSINEGHDIIGKQAYELEDELDISITKKRGNKHKKHKKRARWFSTEEWIEISLCLFYTYTTFLAILALTLAPRFRAVSNTHLVILLLIALGVYVWRDVAPLATYELQPVDSAGGWLTWSRIGVLTFASAIVPLCIPRVYVPVDPKNPSAVPNPEQTASLGSLMIYHFLEPIVWAAYRTPKLEYEQLPPLADYDCASHLRQRGFDKLDPLRRRKQRHLFWGLMEIFRKDFCVMAIMLTIKALMEFAGPVAIKFLLEYLQSASNDEDPGYIRPWFWILWLFLGPVIGSIAYHWYIFVSTGMLVRTEGMVTQLLFEHSLRIRMIAQATGGSSSNTPKTITPGGDNASVASSETAAIGSRSQLAEGTAEGESHSTDRTVEEGDTQTLVTITGSVKQKDKEESQNEDEGANLIGKINNLMSTDLGNLISGRNFLFVVLFSPIQIIISIYYLYRIMGWSAVIGMSVMVLSFPLQGKIAYLVNNVQVARMKKTDARVQTVTESMNVIRMIKLFGWEKKVISQVEKKREEELKYYKKRQFLGLTNMNINYVVPLVVMLVTYAAHTLWFKQTLDAATVFSSVGVFDVLRNQLHQLFWHVPMMVQAKVSLDRMDEFLQKTELLDTYKGKDNHVVADPNPPAPDAIGFRNATFTWTRHVLATPTPSRRNFRLHVDEEVLFRRGKINMVVGPTGCGKTSLLMALLGEMHFVPSTPDSWFSLPRDGGVAYAAQEAWVQNETIRENIIFGAEFDETRYNKVISQCGLERDLTLFDAGDQTEVGEKGMTLSGGQKARVSLARAIYSKADIIVLDDVLSALDVHTSRWIVDNCFRGDLVVGRTMIVVTHNVAMVSEVADFVVSLGTDGRIASQGSIDEAYRSNPKLKAEAEKDEELERKGDQVVDDSNPADKKDDGNAKKSDGKLMVAEEVAVGHVGWPALKLFLLAFGGFWFWLIYMSGFVLSNVAVLGQTYWLGVWARAYEVHLGHSERVNASFYLEVYGIACGVGMIIYSGAFVIHVLGSVRASRRIHNQLTKSVLGAPLRWLDSTPVGRVVARFTQDIRSLDGPLPDELNNLVDMSIGLLSRLIAVIVFSPIFTIPGAAVFVIGFWLGKVYMVAQLSVKREMSNARSPLFSHFGAAVQGITSIRAYNAEGQFKNEALRRVDKYTRVARTFYNLNRWICIRMDVLGGLFAAGLASYLVYFHTSVDASNTGFSLNMAVAFSGTIIWWVRALNDFEVQGNSLERIQDYVQIEQEPRAVSGKVPPAYWPASGNIRVENLTARYSNDGPAVLHNLSFEIKSGERIGVVGRTGSGKSSLTLSLLRMIPIEGNIYYEQVSRLQIGIPTHAVNLEALRSSITIIPQQPELLSGTVRQNLDPFDEYDDAVLNAALRSAGLDTVQSEDDDSYIGLDSGVSAGGGNFSLGQRQILALARAIVRRSKVLILDEATAAIDYKTDTAIQKSLRTELNDRTLIIVAHRLQTICDADKIMALEAGKIVEFDSPAALLQKKSGVFKSLVDESGDRDALYDMAKGQ